MRPTTEPGATTLYKEITLGKKIKHFGSTRDSREKIMGPQSAHEKQILDPRNTYEKKFWSNKSPTRENIGPARPIIARNSHNLAHSPGAY